MSFKGLQKTFSRVQINNGPVEKVFPLLCPVREKEWLEGWEYTMIHSRSGFIEKDCVFTTPNPGGPDTVWQVTQYDPQKHLIEFLRVTPAENVVKINIRLRKREIQTTTASIRYQYTALNEKQNAFIKDELEEQFAAAMDWWEKAINHYLTTGRLLRKT